LAGFSTSKIKVGRNVNPTPRPFINPATIAAIRAALGAAGVVFLPEHDNGPGVALRKE